MTKKTNRRRATKKRTLPEFRAWLQGVEELQPDDWAPNAEQWTLIRKAIENIVDEEPRYVEPHGSSVQYGPASGPHPTHMVPPGSTTAPAMPPGVPPMPPVASSGLPAEAVIEMSPEAKKMLAGEPSAVGGAPGMVPKTKTPDIDTADGNFTSPFS